MMKIGKIFKLIIICKQITVGLQTVLSSFDEILLSRICGSLIEDDFAQLQPYWLCYGGMTASSLVLLDVN
jgi:hypothetical protein